MDGRNEVMGTLLVEAASLARMIKGRMESGSLSKAARKNSLFSLFGSKALNVETLQIMQELNELCTAEIKTDYDVLRLLELHRRLVARHPGSVLDDYRRVVVSLQENLNQHIKNISDSLEKNHWQLFLLGHLLAEAEELQMAEDMGRNMAKEVHALPTILYHHRMINIAKEKCDDNDFNQHISDKNSVLRTNTTGLAQVLASDVMKYRKKRIELTVTLEIMSGRMRGENIKTLTRKIVSRELIDFYLDNLIQQEKRILLKWYICMSQGETGERLMSDLQRSDMSDLLCTHDIEQIIKYHLLDGEDGVPAQYTKIFSNEKFNYIYEEVEKRLHELSLHDRCKILRKFHKPEDVFLLDLKTLLTQLEKFDEVFGLLHIDSHYVPRAEEVELVELIRHAEGVLSVRFMDEVNVSMRAVL